jgi:hypothetical protein
MIAHRLKVWVSRVGAALMRALAFASRPAVPVTPVHPRRALATVGSPPAHRSGLASSRWLDDSRRLRARPVPRPALPPASKEHLRQILRDPRWAAAFNAAPATRSPRAPQSGDPRSARQTGEAAPGRPLTSSSASATPDAQAARERRRLDYVRELVRRGIYNEGFDAASLPEQYRPRPLPPDQTLG